MLIFMLLFAGAVVVALISIAVFYAGNRRNIIARSTHTIDGHAHSKP